MTDARPLTNDEVIEQLTRRGIRATACPECGKVKEVVDDKIVPHTLTPLRDCKGSGMDLLGDVEAAFERLVSDVPPPPEDDEQADIDRIGQMAAEEAVERLAFLFDAVEHQGNGRDSKVYGTSGQEFCGCTPCIVREVVATVWPYACHAQFTDMLEVLITTASDSAASPTTRQVAQMLAETLVDRHEQQQSAE